MSREREDDGALVVRFEVADSGPGLSEDEIGRLFSTFTQVDSSVNRRHGGTGLGLAISKRLCTLMGGEIGVDSEVGGGCVFWFTVPLTRLADNRSGTDRRRAPADSAAIPPPDDRRLRILLAEDNHVNQKIVMAMLAVAGHSVDVAANGVEAIEAVTARPYDIVLMDIHMPEMDGITATRRIRELGGGLARIPIIAVTANAMKGDRERYLSAGMTDYVAKPIESDKLFEVISRHCAIAPTPKAADEAAEQAATPAEARHALADLVDDLDDVLRFGT